MCAFPIQVKFPQGTEMLNIFKNFSCKTSILDDFDFYENRQKVMQDRRSKPLTTSFDHPLAKAEICTNVGMVPDKTKKNEEQRNDVAEVPSKVATEG